MESKFLIEDLTEISNYIYGMGFMSSNILVTGATGLIGSLIIKALLQFNKMYSNQPIQIYALARNPEKVKAVFCEDIVKSNDLNLQFIYQDIIEDLTNLPPCDYVIHTASPTTSKYFMSNPVEVMDSIYTGTKHILEYAKQKNVKCTAYLSSMEVYGSVDDESRAAESELGRLDIQNIRSSYSEAKRLSELMCKSYVEEYGLPVVIARLAQTFGAGVPITENRVFAQFARSAVKGEDIVLHTKGNSFGNYCYTADVIRAIFLLLAQGVHGDAYNIVNEETTRSIADMAELVISNFSNGKSKVVYDIPAENDFGYAPDTKLKLSGEKLKQLGWHPTYDLLQMYERMIPSLLEGLNTND